MSRLEVGTKVKIKPGVLCEGEIGTISGYEDCEDWPYVVEFSSDESYPYGANEFVVVLSHPATPPEGMTSEQLGDYVAEFIRACHNRVTGVGNAQYSTDTGQAFEAMTPVELIDMAREEVQDLAVYAAMTDIRLARVRAALTNTVGDDK